MAVRSIRCQGRVRDELGRRMSLAGDPPPPLLLVFNRLPPLLLLLIVSLGCLINNSICLSLGYFHLSSTSSFPSLSCPHPFIDPSSSFEPSPITFSSPYLFSPIPPPLLTSLPVHSHLRPPSPQVHFLIFPSPLLLSLPSSLLTSLPRVALTLPILLHPSGLCHPSPTRLRCAC